MYIDWNAIATAPQIHQLGVMIRRHLKLWPGILTHTGEAIPLGASGQLLEHPLCDCFKANPVRVDEKDTQMSCDRSLRQWADQPNASLNLTCHAGMNARVKALVDLRGQNFGAVYTSGFITERNETRSLIDIKRALERAGFEESRLPAEWFEKLKRATPVDEGVIATLLAALQHETQQLLEAQLRQNRQHDERERGVFEGMIGDSPPMRRLFHMIDRVSRTDSSVMILGENGTGKELVARAIHRRSRRNDKPYVVQNCAAIPDELIESELFGHKRGAFSGAHRDRRGLFEAANHGTFFLDEIGEMDVSLQSKLLRVLQEGTFLPVGGETSCKVDVRVLCATNRDLTKMVEEKSFREDLYYRINVFAVRVPALRERPDDIPVLAQHFLTRAARVHGTATRRFSEESVRQLVAYSWPGNVRELENEIERLVIMAGDEEEIQVSSLSPRLGGDENVPMTLSTLGMTMPGAVEQLERQMMVRALEETGWNKTQAAKVLGVSRRNLIRKVARYELEDEEEQEL